MNSLRSLHFSMGPVQEFVFQARRTRDFWSGSFILSYLAAHAMAAIIESGGTIEYPAVRDAHGQLDPLLRAVMGHDTSDLGGQLTVGSVPNRFLALVDSSFDPGVCVRAVGRAWSAIAEAVWQRYLVGVDQLGMGTRQIWEDQVNSYWEFKWALSEDSSALDRRKNWRTHIPIESAGDKCFLVNNLQELSGYVRSAERVEQDAFWAEVKRRLPTLDLGETERLCAIALIKRLFPRVAEGAMTTCSVRHEASVIGLSVPQHFPSTSFIAAVHWIERMMADPDGQSVCDSIVALASRLGVANSSRSLEFACLERGHHHDVRYVDGGCLHESSLVNDRNWPTATEAERRDLAVELRFAGAASTTFYAALVMDGDRIGQLLAEHPRERIRVSAAVNRFSSGVLPMVRRHNGVLIFAGGDDVLALLPLEDAIACAYDLNALYAEAFASEAPDIGPASISAGIVFAPYGEPLRSVLEDAQRLLTRVAKDDCGRDAIAIVVRKGSGPSCVWSAPWSSAPSWEEIRALVSEFGDPAGGFLSSLVMKIRELFGDYSSPTDTRLTEDDAKALIVAEYLSTRGLSTSRHKAVEFVDRVYAMCARLRKHPHSGLAEHLGHSADGPMLVRFLAGEGVWQ